MRGTDDRGRELCGFGAHYEFESDVVSQVQRACVYKWCPDARKDASGPAKIIVYLCHCRSYPPRRLELFTSKPRWAGRVNRVQGGRNALLNKKEESEKKKEEEGGRK